MAREDIAAVDPRLTVTRANDETLRIEAKASGLPERLSSRKGEGTAACGHSRLRIGTDRSRRDRSGTFPSSAARRRAGGCRLAVLRYDKLGVGQSGGRVESASLADYAEDVRAAVRMKTDRQGVDRRRIAVVGQARAARRASAASRRSGSRRGAARDDRHDRRRPGHVPGDARARAIEPLRGRRQNRSIQRQIQQAVLTGKGWETISIPPAVRRQPKPRGSRASSPTTPRRSCRGRSAAAHRPGGGQIRRSSGDADKLEALARSCKKAGPVEVVKVPGINTCSCPRRRAKSTSTASSGSSASALP